MQISINIQSPKLKLPKFSKPSGPNLLTFALLMASIPFWSFVAWSAAHKSPIPPEIKAQVSYKVLYPAKTDSVDPSSYDYKQDSKILSFDASLPNGANITVTQQPAPDTLISNGQPYYAALGLHPYAQFQSKYGPVALAKFWETGTLKPVGQTAILGRDNILFVAHSDKSLSNSDWRDFMDSLKITR